MQHHWLHTHLQNTQDGSKNGDGEGKKNKMAWKSWVFKVTTVTLDGMLITFQPWRKMKYRENHSQKERSGIQNISNVTFQGEKADSSLVLSLRNEILHHLLPKQLFHLTLDFSLVSSLRFSEFSDWLSSCESHPFFNCFHIYSPLGSLCMSLC